MFALPVMAGGAENSFVVAGRVVNAVNGTPVARALVNLNNRAVLTDGSGRFEFRAFTPNATQTGNPNAAQAYVKVSKPGYSAALDAMEALGQQPVSDLTKPLELVLYPNALVTGQIIGSDRQPLPKVPVLILREMGDEAQRRLMPVGATQTDSHGQFRFDEGGGRYALLVRYSPRVGETGEAVLPQRFPEAHGGGGSTNTFVVHPGEERKVDLQVRTGIAYPVTLQADGSEVRNVRVQVKTGTGSTFTTFAQPTRTPGEFRLDLPSGSYQLHAIQQTREVRTEADGRIAVAGKPVTGLAMHFAELPLIPVQVTVDASAVSTTNTGSLSATNNATAPTAQSLNLYLRDDSEGSGEDGFGDTRITALPDKTFVLQPGSGSYRLAAPTGGQWFVERATYGTTDLLTQNLTISSGTGTDVIRVVVSNAMGQVAGTVRHSGVPGRSFVYLIRHEPGLTPLYATPTSNDGMYQMRVPPGTYTIVAYDHRFPGDLLNPEVAGKLTGGSLTQVAAGGKASVDLELQRVETVQ